MATSLYEPVTLQASAAKTATGTGSAVVGPFERLSGVHGALRSLALVLDVTAAATDVGDTLDVFVQTKLDGTNWLDVAAFTQVLGNGGAKTYVEKLTVGLDAAGFEAASTLAAGSTRHLLGKDWLVRWAITDAGADNASFTFSVVAVPA